VDGIGGLTKVGPLLGSCLHDHSRSCNYISFLVPGVCIRLFRTATFQGPFDHSSSSTCCYSSINAHISQGFSYIPTWVLMAGCSQSAVLSAGLGGRSRD
jgi:hypothetical protein